jgi:ribosomal protein S18 acetylase RimI-like enzyme
MGAAHQTGAKTVSLEVRPSNAGAVSFYRRLGLEVIGRRPGYYPETGEDALIMGKSLEGEST